MNERQTVAGAYAEAEKAQQALRSHEDLCAERYGNIHSTLGELKKLTWGVILGGSGFVCVTLFAILVRAAGLS